MKCRTGRPGLTRLENCAVTWVGHVPNLVHSSSVVFQNHKKTNCTNIIWNCCRCSQFAKCQQSPLTPQGALVPMQTGQKCRHCFPQNEWIVMAECVTISLHLQVYYAMILLSNGQPKRDNLVIYCGMLTYAGYRSYPIRTQYIPISHCHVIFFTFMFWVCLWRIWIWNWGSDRIHFWLVVKISRFDSWKANHSDSTRDLRRCEAYCSQFLVWIYMLAFFGSITMQRPLIFFKCRWYRC